MAAAARASVNHRPHTHSCGEDISLQLHISTIPNGYEAGSAQTTSDGINRPPYPALAIQHLPPFFGFHTGAKAYFSNPLFVTDFVRIIHAEYSRE